ncbi:hypothetical protein BGZ94_001055 [Podila epigama]|nr:hypothetical protein BGZ94_001055 [Podila epigama]
MKSIQTIIAIVLATLFISSSADPANCRCLSKVAGNYCGQSPLMTQDCHREMLYQCNGVKMSKPMRWYGLCSKGCVITGQSGDHCRV